MSGEILTSAEGAAPEPEDTRPIAGFFGKLPGTGDFVERGLPPAFRRNWDGWLTRHIAPRHRAGAVWPEGGLRFRLISGGYTAAGLILPSQDSAGRAFPLSVMVIARGELEIETIDQWCAAALPLVHAATVLPTDPDALWYDLDALDAPEPSGETPGAANGPMLLWTSASPPQIFDPDTTPDPLNTLFP